MQLRTKKTSILGCSSYEQGSSWAVEVGSHLKVCSIVVENLTIKGQMLVEVCTCEIPVDISRLLFSFFLFFAFCFFVN